MAMIAERYCSTCQKMTYHYDLKCRECESTIYKKRITDWHDQPLEVKLEDLRKRLSRLEQGPVRY